MFYSEKKRDISIAGKYDVVVAGAGPAGISAAVLAARGGAKVLIIEYLGDVGGISTSGLMSHFTGNANSKIYREILSRGAMHGEITTVIDPEKLKTVYLEMLAEAGADILLYTFVCEAIVE
ncbi:MAG: FAD-dependent oxidoreductase, partial [Oscillospiraceae bacterium]|nr:FAD-dependent oxidoreductase [Oscillospiraceae bacterium]